MMKKTWSAPVLEELSISATLGGTNKTFTETLVDLNGKVADPNFGTIPNPMKP
jgi:hypothetical protein